jgi:hypothetical protein
MKPSELFDLWAPPAAVWSRWAKPVLFAELSAVAAVDQSADPLPRLDLNADQRTAVVLDLPAATSVKVGLAFVESGFRPVPLYNGNRGPGVLNIGGIAVVDNDPILAWLSAGASFLAQHPLPLGAPPVFLLDSRRRPQVTPDPGRYDNRWIVFPQDFPSANFLKSQGIAQAMLIQEDVHRQPQEDLAHVLLRWQEGGLPIFVTSLDFSNDPLPLVVERPSRFRSLWYGALAVMGLRRNSAGGFGSTVPQPSSSGG